MTNKIKNTCLNSLLCKNYQTYLIYTVIIFAFYAPLLSQKYAFFDDYATLGNAITHNSNFFQWDVYSGRLIYAFLRVFVQPYMTSIENFYWLRLFSVIWTLFFSIFTHIFLTKRTQINSNIFIFFTPLFLAILPSFIVINSWATCFPYTFALVIGGLAYTSTFDINQKTSFFRVLLGLFLLICSFLIYQPLGMTFLFFVFLSNCLDNRKINYKNLIISMMLLGISMVTSLVATKIIPKILYGQTLSRTEITNDITGKIHWFIHEVFINTVSNYQLNFNIYYIILSFIIFIIGLFFIAKNKNGIIKLLVSCALTVLVLLPNLVIKESWAASRICIGISMIITTIMLYGFVNIITKIKFEKIQAIIVSSLLLISYIHIQGDMYKGFISSEQLQYQALTQQISSQIPQNFTGKIRFDTSSPYQNSFSELHRYDEFGHHELIEEWSLRGMAASIKKTKGFNYQIEWDMVLSKKNPCANECIVVNTGNIMRNASIYH